MLTLSIILCCNGILLSEMEKQPQVEKAQKIEFVFKKESELKSTRGKEIIAIFEPHNKTKLTDLESQPVDGSDIASLLKRDPSRKAPILIGILLMVPEQTTVAHINELMELYSNNNSSLVPVRVTFYARANTEKKKKR